MINKYMENKEENSSKSFQKPVENVDKKPNENAGFYFSSFVKITDPNSKEVLVQTRGDN